MSNLLYDAKFTVVEASAVAGTSTLTTDVLDMTGYDSVMFVAMLGDVTDTSVLALTAKGNSADSVSSPTPTTYEGAATYTAGASDADGKLMIVDIEKPRDRYVFATLARGTANAVLNGIIAIQYNGSLKPEVQGSTVLVATHTNDPDAAA